MALTAPERAANRRRAAKLGYRDVNGDGIPDADTLDREQVAKEYGYALNVIYSNPELRALFEQAVSDKSGQWQPEKFKAALQNTDWWRNNDQYARTAWAQEMTGGADWENYQKVARTAVQQRATELGADLTGAELDSLTRQFLYGGWGEAGRSVFLDQALSGEIAFMPDSRGVMTLRGQAGKFTDRLKQVAIANGLQYSDQWYLDQAQSVAHGLQTEEDVMRDIRNLAAGKWGAWGDKIKAGQNAYDLASPYIQTMADVLEVSPLSIGLNDPYIQRAMTGVDAQGNPAPMSLWDFQRQLRNDPRWMNTNQAQNQVTGVVDAVMQMFGLRG